MRNLRHYPPSVFEYMPVQSCTCSLQHEHPCSILMMSFMTTHIRSDLTTGSGTDFVSRMRNERPLIFEFFSFF